MQYEFPRSAKHTIQHCVPLNACKEEPGKQWPVLSWNDPLCLGGYTFPPDVDLLLKKPVNHCSSQDI